MRRIWILLSILLCLSLPWVEAAAVSNASLVQTNAVVSQQGSCQVTTTIQLHLESPGENLAFPLPKDADNVQLNGTLVRTQYQEDTLLVMLPSIAAGDYTFNLSYRLPLVVASQKDKLLLELPLLSGFSYPIEAMEITVTLPEAVETRPSFISGYHQEGIESRLVTTMENNTIFAATTQSLKDHETLSMTLEVPEEMFPQIHLQEPLLSGWDGAIILLIGLSVLYYLIALLPVVPRQVRCFTPPDGINAGEVGTCLTGCGPDLSMMVLSWAQLGYIRMEITHSKRVNLYKQMEMGNERSEFEIRVFQALFRNRPVVNGTSFHYARLCRSTAAKSPLLRQLFLPSSGNPRIFRILSGLAGGISGIVLALNAGSSSTVHTLLGILFFMLCSALSYFLQSAGKCLPLRDKTPLYLGLGCGALWLALGLLVGQLEAVIPMVLYQFLSGIAAAYGGRRSERGKRCLAELRSLRSFMVSTPASELQRMLQMNPNYFYELAPYALAMGVDRQFARRFGNMPLPDCSFLVTEKQTEMTASQLMALLRQAADTLNALQKRLAYERLRK